ncbi:polysaccharide deacetylase family protein [Paenibacillus sp. ACRRX]|uniref:polysaccharide deacetylase family protein n=1 Tax=Paenibacillus sp. ACRRX TaxID=2918206 RepID=UPI001EF4BE80|nr:polysaccharide deacetylase family protein [Paenibacillus sp. ACRRX]MCG7409640.1 polysaccharide deacetylase family protein [Paenibacillus sp. ACRRX]
MKANNFIHINSRSNCPKRNRIHLRTKILLTGMLVLSLFTGCASSTEAKSITATVNGQNVQVESGIKLIDGQLMVSPAFIKSVFGMQVEVSKQPVGAATSAAAPASKVYYKNQVAVLMYHDLADKPEVSHILPVSQFERHMKLLETHGFKVISMDEYIDFMILGKKVPNNAVLLTFDDGYESFYTKAYPILRKYNYTATNFVIVSAIDNQTGRKKLTWDQMREMKQAGMSFYSHTYDSHKYGAINAAGKEKPMLTRHLYLKDKKRIESDQEYITRITADLSTAEQRLKQELGNKRSVIAFPYGAYNNDVIKVLNKLGTQLSFTVKKGMTTKDDKNAFRFDAGNSKQTPEALINLIGGTTLVKNVGLPITVTIDGRTISFSKKLYQREGSDVMLPLREFCAIHDIKVEWDHKQKRVHLKAETLPQHKERA